MSWNQSSAARNGKKQISYKIQSLFYRNGVPQPDNFEGIKEGPIETEFDIGVTIEGLQEYHDEACLAVLNNNYSDGVVWHDVACHFRSVIVCEDSDQLIALVQQQNAVDVSDTVKKGEDSRLVDPDAVIAEEERHEAELAALAARRPPRRPQGKYCLLVPEP